MKKSERRRLFSVVFACMLTLVLLNVRPLYAQSSQWAVKMFSELGTELTHDFGSVALHADVEQRFQFKNIYKEDVVVASVSSNCGCTKASATKTVIHPNEIGEIVARVDTSGREHTKQRKATIRVTFSKPLLSEVQLQVRTYIRPDVGFEPGLIEFGTASQGEHVVKKGFLQYKGNPNWAITAIQKTNPSIRAEAQERSRDGNGVVYEITVELKPDAKPGYIHDLLRFQTNEYDRVSSSVFLPVQGLVVEPLSAKPSYLQLGVVGSNQELTKNLVVSGATPFKIIDVSSDDPRLSFVKTDLTRSVHVVPITLSPDGLLGDVAATIVISTQPADAGSEVQKIAVQATGHIVGKLKKTPQTSNRISTSVISANEIGDGVWKAEYGNKLANGGSVNGTQPSETGENWISAPSDPAPQYAERADEAENSTEETVDESSWQGPVQLRPAVTKTEPNTERPIDNWTSGWKVAQVSNEEKK